MRDLIEKELLVILDEPVWAVGRAAAMLWIQIGERRIVPAWGGGTKEVGKYALHIDCSWYWKDGATVIADQNSSLNHLDNKLEFFISCQSVTATDDGSIEITFSDQSTLNVKVETPDDSEENKEMWRFFQPATNQPHFVVGSQGMIA